MTFHFENGEVITIGNTSVKKDPSKDQVMTLDSFSTIVAAKVDFKAYIPTRVAFLVYDCI